MTVRLLLVQPCVVCSSDASVSSRQTKAGTPLASLPFVCEMDRAHAVETIRALLHDEWRGSCRGSSEDLSGSRAYKTAGGGSGADGSTRLAMHLKSR